MTPRSARHQTTVPRIAAVVLLSAGVLVTTAGPGAAEAPSASPAADLCSAMTEGVHLRLHPATGDSLLTTSRAAADAAQRDLGYSDDDGVAFLAATNARGGKDRVTHLLDPATGRNAYSLDRGQIRELQRAGYEVQRDRFFASAEAADCLDPVYELVRASDGQQRLAVTEGQRDEFVAAGFTAVGVAFYAATDPTFSIAVIPDTQQEVHADNDKGLFLNRAEWLAANEDQLDLRYITHTGDVVDWDDPAHEQYEIASRGVAVLDSTGIPWSFSIGNHDTMATGVGGSARPGEDVIANQRITETFNSYFGIEHVENLQGTFEEGKVDNSYSTFAAGGVDWLVLNLELWPRAAAVDWAKEVLETHPDHNVMINTHSFLEGNGTIKQNNGGYGATSPQYVHDQLVSQYANVRFVFSGHTGQFAHTEMTGVHGNRIHMILGTFHDKLANQTRIMEIDTRAGGFDTYVYAPSNDKRKDDASAFSRQGLALID